MHELIIGGQKSGKSRRAEARAAQWLATGGGHAAVLVATALPADAEMAARIRRHQAERLPGLRLVEAPSDLAGAIARESRPDTLLVIDCLTLWLTQRLMPPTPAAQPASAAELIEGLCAAVAAASGPLVLVGNEIGSGVVPLGAEVRAFVDALGSLQQALAALCPRVTLMVAGLPLVVKGQG